MKIRFSIIFCLACILFSACAASPPTLANRPDPGSPDIPSSGFSSTQETNLPAASPASPTPTAGSVLTVPDFQPVELPGAKTVSLALAGEGQVYVIYGQQEQLYVSRLLEGGQDVSEPVQASGDKPVWVLPIERPAIAADDHGRVGVAWLEMTENHQTRVWFARSEDGGNTFQTGVRVASQQGETAMVQLALDSAGSPALTWLNGSALKFTRSSDGGVSFETVKSIGQAACECCQPVIRVAGNEINIAYRGLETDPEKGHIRDAAFIRSGDGGETFGPVSPVSDTHWYLAACPISGPALAVGQDYLYIAWMDGREAPSGSPYAGDIWFSTSADRGASFSENIRVNPEAGLHHTLPALAVGPGGRIHLVWEAQFEEFDGLLYVISDDRGQTFSDPVTLVDDSVSDRGNPQKPFLAIDGQGRVYLAWTDRLGAKIATWEDSN